MVTITLWPRLWERCCRPWRRWLIWTRHSSGPYPSSPCCPLPSSSGGKYPASSLVSVCFCPPQRKCVGCADWLSPWAYTKHGLNSMARADLTKPTPPLRSAQGWYTRPLTGCMNSASGRNGTDSFSAPPQYDSSSWSPMIPGCPAGLCSRWVKTTGRSSQRTKFLSLPHRDK